MRKNTLLKGFILVLTITLSACSTQHGTHKPDEPHKHKPTLAELILNAVDGDGPPDDDFDVTKISNATPKFEPLSRYGNPPSYEVFGDRYHVLPHCDGYEAEGLASWYGRKFHGKRTSSGEPYDMFAMTAAHKSLPLPTYAKVKNLNNGKEIIVKINDRGPFVKDRIIDLSYAAAKKLGVHATGTANVRVTAIDPAEWHKQLAKKKQATKLAKTKSQQLAQNNKTKGRANAKTKTTKTTVAANNKIYIQLGAFNSKLNAQSLADQASTLTQALTSVTGNKDLYKVRIGPLKTKKEAELLQQKLVVLNGASHAKLVYE